MAKRKAKAAERRKIDACAHRLMRKSAKYTPREAFGVATGIETGRQPGGKKKRKRKK